MKDAERFVSVDFGRDKSAAMVCEIRDGVMTILAAKTVDTPPDFLLVGRAFYAKIERKVKRRA